MTFPAHDRRGGRKLAPLTWGQEPSDEQRAIAGLVSRMGTLTAVSGAVGFGKGYLSAVLHGKRRASNRLRRALGLRPRTVPAEPCHHCGDVHIRRTCPARKGETKPRRRLPPPLVRLVAGLLAAGKIQVRA